MNLETQRLPDIRSDSFGSGLKQSIAKGFDLMLPMICVS